MNLTNNEDSFAGIIRQAMTDLSKKISPFLEFGENGETDEKINVMEQTKSRFLERIMFFEVNGTAMYEHR